MVCKSYGDPHIEPFDLSGAQEFGLVWVDVGTSEPSEGASLAVHVGVGPDFAGADAVQALRDALVGGRTRFDQLEFDALGYDLTSRVRPGDWVRVDVPCPGVGYPRVCHSGTCELRAGALNSEACRWGYPRYFRPHSTYKYDLDGLGVFELFEADLDGVTFAVQTYHCPAGGVWSSKSCNQAVVVTHDNHTVCMAMLECATV